MNTCRHGRGVDPWHLSLLHLIFRSKYTDAHFKGNEMQHIYVLIYLEINNCKFKSQFTTRDRRNREIIKNTTAFSSENIKKKKLLKVVISFDLY